MNLIGAILLSAVLSACGNASSATNVRVEIVTAPDNARCYVFIQGDEVRGGSCVQ